jgi:hypothetical protein
VLTHVHSSEAAELQVIIHIHLAHGKVIRVTIDPER